MPEVGGLVDPVSEAHDLAMSLFGGLPKAERRRQHRTRAAVLALATQGRWLGGRPDYGYRFAGTEVPSPQPPRPRRARRRTAEPDPEAASVVRRIFELSDASVGFRSIAQRLEADGIFSPGETGPLRHPGSTGDLGGSAVRAILVNPRYIGHRVAGRQAATTSSSTPMTWPLAWFRGHRDGLWCLLRRVARRPSTSPWVSEPDAPGRAGAF